MSSAFETLYNNLSVEEQGVLPFMFSVDCCGIIKDSRMNCRDRNVACQKDIWGGCSPTLQSNSCKRRFPVRVCLDLQNSFQYLSRELARAVCFGELWVLSPLLVGFLCSLANKHEIPVCSQMVLCLG